MTDKWKTVETKMEQKRGPFLAQIRQEFGRVYWSVVFTEAEELHGTTNSKGERSKIIVFLVLSRMCHSVEEAQDKADKYLNQLGQDLLSK